MFGTNCTVAKLTVRDTCIILVFYVTFDALTNVLVATGIESAFSVVFAV